MCCFGACFAPFHLYWEETDHRYLTKKCGRRVSKIIRCFSGFVSSFLCVGYTALFWGLFRTQPAMCIGQTALVWYRSSTRHITGHPTRTCTRSAGIRPSARFRGPGLGGCNPPYRPRCNPAPDRDIIATVGDCAYGRCPSWPCGCTTRRPWVRIVMPAPGLGQLGCVLAVRVHVHMAHAPRRALQHRCFSAIPGRHSGLLYVTQHFVQPLFTVGFQAVINAPITENYSSS